MLPLTGVRPVPAVIASLLAPTYALGAAQAADHVERSEFVAASGGLLPAGARSRRPSAQRCEAWQYADAGIE